MRRPSWHKYYMDIVRVVAERSTCLRRQIGAIIVRNKQILSTGYNGAPSGARHCSELGGCYRIINNIPSGERHETCRGAHSETNAIAQAAKHGVSIDSSIMYVTCQPCSMCAKSIINAGIKEVYWEEGYPDSMTKGLFDEAGIIYGQLTIEGSRADTNEPDLCIEPSGTHIDTTISAPPNRMVNEHFESRARRVARDIAQNLNLNTKDTEGTSS